MGHIGAAIRTSLDGFHGQVWTRGNGYSVTANEVIHGAEEAFHWLAGEELTLVTKLDPEAGTATVDPEILRRLLLELVFEAKESMREGGTLSIATARLLLDENRSQDWPDAPSGDYVMISITARHSYLSIEDTGPEFDFLNVLRILQSSGAYFNVTTEHRRYSALRILLPRTASDLSESGASSVNSEPAPDTILLSAVNAPARSSLRSLLLKNGYAVLEIVNGNRAEVIRSDFGGKIDLVLRYDEAEGANPGILHRLPSLTDVPVIALPFRFREGDSDDIWTASADAGYLEGSYSPDELVHTIHVALEAARPRHVILVVDDDLAARRMIAQALESAGYDVSEAANGREALQLIGTRKIHVVLTELVMPEIEGLELIGEIHKTAPQIKVVAMSGVSRANTYLSVARALGAHAAIPKPLETARVLQTIRDVLGTS